MIFIRIPRISAHIEKKLSKGRSKPEEILLEYSKSQWIQCLVHNTENISCAAKIITLLIRYGRFKDHTTGFETTDKRPE